MIDLTEDQKTMLCAMLAKHGPVCEVFVFGSRATGAARRNSDLDLMLRGQGVIAEHEIECLRDALSESDFPYLVDIVDWYALPESFRARVQNDLVTLC